MKLLKTHTSASGEKVAKVYKDSEWGEHVVKFYKGGKHLSKADYHTDDKDDAHGTAMQHIKEEVENLEELSKKTLGSYIKSASHDAKYLGYEAGANDWAFKRDTSKINKKSTNRLKGISKAVKKLTKEDVTVSAVDKYVLPEAVSAEEALNKKLESIHEVHRKTITALFETLDSENKSLMLESLETKEGILEILDFAIRNKD